MKERYTAMSEYSKPEIKTDCFAYDDKIKPICYALKGLYCATEHCKFYKSKEQEAAERRKA